MAFVPGFRSRLMVAEHAWSAYTVGFNMASNVVALDKTVLSDNGVMQFMPGQSDATASIDMLLDTAYATSSQFALLNTWQSAAQVVSLAPSGLTRGNEAWLLSALESQATVATAVADKVTAQLALVVSGQCDFGVVLDDVTAITIDTDGTSTDNGALTSNGGVAHLHVTAFSGLTNDVIVVEHSTDNVTFATLGTFATVTGVTSERLVIAPATTVNRYVRVRDDVTGTGTCTRQVSFARR